MSLRLFAFLARRLRAHPVVLVGTAREEELPDAPLLRRLIEDLGRGPGFLLVALAPLSRSDTAALVRRLVKAATEETAVVRLGEVVWVASGGNPLVAVETVRAIDQGVPPDAVPTLGLPERVRAVIVRRLERLSERARQLLAAAAVIGRQFDFPLLQHVVGRPALETAEEVEELVRRRVLH